MEEYFDFGECSFPVPFGMEKKDFIAIDNIIGKGVVVTDLEFYEKFDPAIGEKKKHVSVKLMVDGEARYTRTGSAAVYDFEKCFAYIAEGKKAVGRFIKQASTKNTRNLMTRFVAINDPDSLKEIVNSAVYGKVQ